MKFVKEMADTENYIFYPKTADEARTLQEALIEMGFSWGDGDRRVANIDNSIRNGLVLLDAKIYTRSESDTRNYVTMPVDSVVAGYVPEERRYLQEQFAKINARLDAMEKRIDEIRDAVLPDQIDKPVLKKPAAGKVTP